MDSTEVTQATIWEDQDAAEMARILVDGTAITQSSIGAGGSITRKIFDVSSGTPDTAISTDTLVYTDVTFDDLQTDSGWDTEVDATGFNFRDRVAGSKFPTGDAIYRVEYQFVGASAEKFIVVYEHPCKAIRGS